jgi:hypothetical protein
MTENPNLHHHCCGTCGKVRDCTRDCGEAEASDCKHHAR